MTVKCKKGEKRELENFRRHLIFWKTFLIIFKKFFTVVLQKKNWKNWKKNFFQKNTDKIEYFAILQVLKIEINSKKESFRSLWKKIELNRRKKNTPKIVIWVKNRKKNKRKLTEVFKKNNCIHKTLTLLSIMLLKIVYECKKIWWFFDRRY